MYLDFFGRQKLYVKKLSNKEGKELFKGQKAKQLYIKGKTYNLIGCGNYKAGEEVVICSYLTQKPLNCAVIGSISFEVNENTRNGFIVLK